MSRKVFGDQIRIEVSGVQEALAKISKYDGKTQLATQESLRVGAKNITKTAKASVPVRTGKLKKSGGSTFNKSKLTARSFFRAPHAHLIELGAKASTTKPKKAKALQIVNGDLGILRYAHEAKIPKRRARPFLSPAAQKEFPVIEQEIREALKKP